MNETTSSTKPAGGTRPELSLFKTVEWAYPSSHNAEQYGFGDTGCWVASLVNPSMSGETYDTIAIYGAAEKAKAVEMAGTIDRPWLPSYLATKPELTEPSRSSIEPSSNVPTDSELLDAIDQNLWTVSYMRWQWVVQSNGQVVGNITKGSTLREALGSALAVTEPITSDPVTADQVNAVLDFATVAGITNRYTASLRGTAARMSAESLCRFCVLNPATPPSEVYESILPVSRPSYGDLLSAANWLLLGLAPEAMEYRPLRAVREWVLGYMGGSEK